MPVQNTLHLPAEDQPNFTQIKLNVNTNILIVFLTFVNKM